MELELKTNAVLVMPYFWDAFDYEPAVQPVPPPLEAWWWDESRWGGNVSRERERNYPNWDND